ncbi:MAG: Gfo/Idh/MocA family oxidoreductase, partial [Verrucomicrobiota bacterium]
GNLKSFLQDDRVQVVGICDVDQQHLRQGLKTAGLNESAGTGDFRELLARKDIDSVMIATPDHWHSIITAAAARAGKDIYCEKPLAASVAEGRFVSDLIKKEKRVLQCGTWRRSGIKTRMACEWIRNGYIGDLKSIEVGVPGKFAIRGGHTGLEEAQPVPEGFDYEMWLGPAPSAPYSPARCHFNFRWVMDYAPGYITDWGAHFLDVAQWGNGTDDSTPTEVVASGITTRAKGIYDAPESFRIDYQYKNGVTMSMISTEDESKWGVKFVGTEGWVFTENERLETHPASLLRTRLKKTDKPLYQSNDHHRNFIDCVKSREITAAPAETAHRAATTCHLGTIASILKRPLKFDPVKEHFPGDDEANQWLMRTMRGPWQLS